MALKPGDRHNFQTLLNAFQRGDIALIESTDAKTGEYRAVICAISVDGRTGEHLVTPFGNLATGNPYEEYTDPTKYVEDREGFVPVSGMTNPMPAAEAAKYENPQTARLGGGLSNLGQRVAASRLATLTKDAFLNLLTRMAEIDSGITRTDGGDDRPPNGDDYNELWDAIQDEINGAIQDAEKAQG